MARRDPVGIRLLTRNGYDWSPRYPLIVEAVNHLKVRSCLIDGEAAGENDSPLAARFLSSGNVQSRAFASHGLRCAMPASDKLLRSPAPEVPPCAEPSRLLPCSVSA